MSTNQQSFAAKAKQVRQRLATMQTAVASAGARLFSPRTPAGTRPTVTFSTPDRGLVPGGPDGGVVESSGEYSSISVFSGGGVGDLLLFLLSLDMKSSLCLGLVKGGLKFCTLGKGSCSYSSHLKKKASLQDDHLFIAADTRSAYVNHHIPASILTKSQLSTILSERHTKEEWVRLLHAWNVRTQEDGSPESNPFSRVGSLMVSSAVTPCRKRKPLYDVSEYSAEDSEPYLVAASSSLSESTKDTYDFEVIPTSSDSGESEIPTEEKLSEVIVKWDMLVRNVNKTFDVIKHFRRSYDDEMEAVHDKITAMDCHVGTFPSNTSGLEDCLSTWEGISFVHQNLSEALVGFTEIQGKLGDFENHLFTADEFIRKMEKGTNDEVSKIKRGMGEIELLLTALTEEHELLMQQIQGGNFSSGSSTQVLDGIQHLTSRIQACENRLSYSTIADDASEKFKSEIEGLRADLKHLEARIPKYNNMMIGGKLFQSKADVELFVSS
jgi:hypothetical protein